MPMPDIVERLKEHAEWAEANIYEVPITLPDDITEAVKEIEQLVKERDAAVAAVHKQCSTCKRVDFCATDAGQPTLCACVSAAKCNWEWRGVREVDNETD